MKTSSKVAVVLALCVVGGSMVHGQSPVTAFQFSAKDKATRPYHYLIYFQAHNDNTDDDFDATIEMISHTPMRSLKDLTGEENDIHSLHPKWSDIHVEAFSRFDD